jgi:hypothetical protein
MGIGRLGNYAGILAERRNLNANRLNEFFERPHELGEAGRQAVIA